MTKILVATDFSTHSKRIVEYAFDLKRVFNASIYMLYVVETVTPSNGQFARVTTFTRWTRCANGQATNC